MLWLLEQSLPNDNNQQHHLVGMKYFSSLFSKGQVKVGEALEFTQAGQKNTNQENLSTRWHRIS